MHYMRQFLSDKDPLVPISYGRKLYLRESLPDTQSFLSGGCGQLLSRGALLKMGKAVMSHASAWAFPEDYPSDLQTSVTLRQQNVPVGSSLDKNGRNQFIVIGLEAGELMSDCSNESQTMAGRVCVY